MAFCVLFLVFGCAIPSDQKDTFHPEEFEDSSKNLPFVPEEDIPGFSAVTWSPSWAHTSYANGFVHRGHGCGKEPLLCSSRSVLHLGF
jgi:hypothetical protein